MGFVVGELALRQVVIGVYFSFPLPIIYYLISHSGLVQTAGLRPQCQGNWHGPIPGIKNNVVVSTADYVKAMNFLLMRSNRILANKYKG
jgi:hypothetical protein